MMIFNYESKKQLKESIGQPLRYTETSIFGPEYMRDGVLYGSNRPSLAEGTGTREFFANVRMRDGVIVEVN